MFFVDFAVAPSAPPGFEYRDPTGSRQFDPIQTVVATSEVAFNIYEGLVKATPTEG